MTSPNPLRAYAAVTAAYWAFMLSDGALRMLVLLHFNSLGFTPVQLAWLFLLYEVAGIVTNLAAGWLAARFGLAAVPRDSLPVPPQFQGLRVLVVDDNPSAREIFVSMLTALGFDARAVFGGVLAIGAGGWLLDLRDWLRGLLR